ncbi:MAG: antitoxin Xre-like helix-turn-helix domain-containing protein, partial [Burkholderiales bacterium]
MADVPVRHASAVIDPAGVLSRAVVRAARLLGLTQRDVAAVLGVSEATASRLFAGRYVLAEERAKEWELARLFVRFYRALLG